MEVPVASPPEQWVVLELSQKAEGEDPDLIRASIQHRIRNAEVFIPASVTTVGGERVVQYLVEGYAFIRRDNPDSAYLRLEETKYVVSVLRNVRQSRQREIATVPASQIQQLRKQIRVEVDQGIGVGDLVLITSGPYRQITARVMEEIPELDKVQVYVELRSKQTIVTLPRAGLKLQERGPLSFFRQRVTALRKWVQVMRPVFAWTEAPTEHLAKIRSTRESYTRLDRGADLYCYIKAIWSPTPSKDALEAKFQEWCRSQDSIDGLDSLGTAVDEIEEAIHTYKRDQMVENIVIDGHQLAIRCAMSPGLADLTDNQGRPTGAIIGFLRSLGSFRKRFENATFYVCWDGSNQRRKAMYDGYKANRTSKTAGEGFFEIDFLKELLPLIGVTQAWHPEEEADDAIATLLRGQLKGQNNVVISTDRDLVQLVTETDSQFVPAVGAGREKHYDVDVVLQEYGVPPSEVVFVRAIDGDSSDNIPGAKGFGLKTAAKLVKLYGTVDAIFASNLAELTRTQHSNLRSAETQVKLNVKLMKLVDDLDLTVTDVSPDQIAASGRLKDVDVQDKVLTPFF